MKYYLVILVILACSIPTHAEIYKWTDSHGNVHFTDKPHKGAKEVELPAVQTFSLPKVPQPTETKEEETIARSYKKILITQPEDQATIRNNQGYVAVSVLLEPSLIEGDKIQLIFDGKPMGQPQTSSVFALNNVYRGTHTLAVKILNANDEQIGISQAVTFFMHRARVGQARGRR
jgi:Domain of unknown function (DUF4124)